LRIFISYSSRDFAIAEAAEATLRRVPGVEPWLDVLRLRPGQDWQQAINDSIDNADALLLLASPASLVSKNVIEEWNRALAFGIPVQVGVVAGTKVPAALAGHPRHDLRVRFEHRLTALAAGDTVGRARPLVPGLVPLPVAAVAMLAALAFVALAGIAALISGTVLDYPVFWAFAAYPAALALAVAVVPIGLLTRRATLRTLGLSCAAAVLFGVVFLVQGTGSELARLPGNFGTGQANAMAAVTLVAAGLSCVALLFTRSVRRRLPSSHSGDTDRWVLGALTARRVSSLLPFFSWQWKLVRLRSGPRSHGPTVRIDHAPADSRVARLVSSACADMGLMVVPADAASDWVLLLVSAHSGMPTQPHPRAVCVLLDSVELPDELRRHHWMDFRQRSADHLHGLLSVLCGDWRERAFLTPIRPHEFRAPIAVIAFAEGCREFIAFIAGATLGTVVTHPVTGREAVLLVVSALLLTFATKILTHTTARRCTAIRYAMTGAAASLLAGWWSATWLWAHWGHLEPSLLPQIVLTMLLPLGLPFFLLFFLVLLWHSWLPAQPGAGTAATSAPLWTPVMPLTFLVATTLSAFAGFSPS
jgi:hypothetical protein